MPSSQKDNNTKRWGRAGAAIFIVAILLFPVEVPIDGTEESLDDEHAFVLFDGHDASFSVNSQSLNGTSLALWSNDSIRASKKAQITLSFENQEIHTTLGKILRDTRKLVIPLPKKTPANARIRLISNGIPEKEALIIRMQRENTANPSYTLYGKKPLAGALLDRLYAEPLIGGDIEYIWLEGKHILEHINPYEKGTDASYRDNKFAIYFPVSYIFSALIQKAGFASFEDYTTIIHPLILASQLLTALCVLYFLYRKKQLAIGLFGFILILFHRFTLYPARVAQIDFPAMLFLVIGMILLPYRPILAYIAISLSLGIKQMAIFIVPIILLYVWQRYRTKKQMIIACACIAIIPTVTLIPFLIDNSKGVFASILHSASRPASGDIPTPDLATLISAQGFSRSAMLCMMALVYLAVWKREVRLFGAALAIFIIFIGFNPAVFLQYLAWIIPFVPLALSEGASPGIPLRSSRRFHNT